MLIPRFTIRWLFGLITAFAFFSLVVAQLVRGQKAWAFVAVAFLATLGLMQMAHSCLLTMTWLMSRVVKPKVRDEQHVHSPFAQDQPAPQIIEPNNADG